MDVEIEIFTNDEVFEAWKWFVDHLTVSVKLIEEHNHYLDHKFFEFFEVKKCIDQCQNADLYLARLYLVSQLSVVSDYLPMIKTGEKSYSLTYFSSILDNDIGRVIRATDTERNRNSFRDSLSEHIIFWSVLATISKDFEVNEFAIEKPNIHPEDKGPDGLAYVHYRDYSIVKIISIKNSINDPKGSISSSKLRKNKDFTLDKEKPKKIFNEFMFYMGKSNGFQRLDEKLDHLLSKMNQGANAKMRNTLLRKKSQFNAAVVSNEDKFSNDLFAGFKRVNEDVNRCYAIYVGSEDWKVFSNQVQENVKDILNSKGVNFNVL